MKVGIIGAGTMGSGIALEPGLHTAVMPVRALGV